MYKETPTWNGMYGRCYHNCLYCFNRLHWNKWGKMRLNEKALKDNLGSGNFYFVGSSCDMFADKIIKDWIIRVLEHLRKFDNKYLLQTKNPKRYREFIPFYPEYTIFGTTIETNYTYLISRYSNAPQVIDRVKEMESLSKDGFDVSLTYEPIMRCDVNKLIEWAERVKPKIIFIGANSQRWIKLPEPLKEEIVTLIKGFRKITTDVRVKDNLTRLIK